MKTHIVEGGVALVRECERQRMVFNAPPQATASDRFLLAWWLPSLVLLKRGR